MNKDMLNVTTAKGVLAVLVGLVFIFSASSIVIRMLFLAAGVFLMYYGLQMLNIPIVNNALNKVKDLIQKVLS